MGCHLSSAVLDRRRLLKAGVAAPFATAFIAAPSWASHADPVAALVADFTKPAGNLALSVAVAQDGHTRFYNAGTRALGARARVDEHAIYEIGSITKTFTGLLLAHAIKEKRLKLSDPVNQHLPAGFGNLAHEGRAVTLADLVTTTSALPDNIPDWRVMLHDVEPRELPVEYAKLLRDYGSANFLADLKATRLVGLPGRTPRHSNAASQLLAIVLERLHQQSYERLIGRYIERPLGMRSGTGGVPDSLLVTGYDGLAMPPLTMPIIRPAGGLRYSAADMVRYIKAQIAGHDPAIALTHEPLWGSADAQGIGFHWIVSKTADSITYLRHSGGTFGFSSYCDFYPAQRYGIVLLTNRAGDFQDKLQQLADSVHEVLCGAPRGLRALETALKAKDYADASATIVSMKTAYPELHLDEDRMNRWGGRLIGEHRPHAARAIFAYNVASFPNSANAHDSYAAALVETGDHHAALIEYRRSLALDPLNANAVQMIKTLSGEAVP